MVLLGSRCSLASLSAPRSVPTGSRGYRFAPMYCNVIPAASISSTDAIRILVHLIARSPQAIREFDCRYFMLLDV